MARIYKRSDRITVKIDEVVVKLAPLTLSQKTEIQQSMLVGQTKGDLKELTQAVAQSMRYSIKGIEGIEDADGNPYKLELDGNGDLTDTCIDDLMNLELTKKLALVCNALVNGVPKQFTDENNKALEGVEVVSDNKETPEKK